jgi:hypothetical protein
MTEALHDSVLTAIALTRGQLLELTGAKSTKATLESNALELLSSEDLLDVLRALALISAMGVLAATAAGGEGAAESFLDAMEARVRKSLDGQS